MHEIKAKEIVTGEDSSPKSTWSVFRSPLSAIRGSMVAYQEKQKINLQLEKYDAQINSLLPLLSQKETIQVFYSGPTPAFLEWARVTESPRTLPMSEQIGSLRVMAITKIFEIVDNPIFTDSKLREVVKLINLSAEEGAAYQESFKKQITSKSSYSLENQNADPQNQEQYEKDLEILTEVDLIIESQKQFTRIKVNERASISQRTSLELNSNETAYEICSSIITDGMFNPRIHSKRFSIPADMAEICRFIHEVSGPRSLQLAYG